MFLGLTGSNSGLFRAPGFIVSPLGKEKKKEKGKEEKRNRKGKEGRRNKKKIRGKKRRRNFTKN